MQPRRNTATSAAGGWDQAAQWYDHLVGDLGSDYHRNVLLPAALRMLAPVAGQRVVDLCCGQGVLVRQLLVQQAGFVLGVDASPRLIAAARSRTPADGRVRYEIADVCKPGPFADESFDRAACLMAVQDLPDLPGFMGCAAKALRPGGRLVILMMHPCFRIPRQTHWGWDESSKIQYRRIDRYSAEMEIPIRTHPGREETTHTTFYHRPLAAYFDALGAAGFGVTQAEELYTHRRSDTGGRARAENRAGEEIPVFLALGGTRT